VNSKIVFLLFIVLLYLGGKIVLEIIADWDYFGRLFADTFRFLFVPSARKDLERKGKTTSRWFILCIFLKMLFLPHFLRYERDRPTKLKVIVDGNDGFDYIVDTESKRE